MPDFLWAESSGRFRDAGTGRFVPEATIRSGVDAIVDRVSQRLQASARGVADGSVSASAFRDELFRGIKDVHIASGLAAYGGKSAATQEGYGYLGSRIKKEYTWATKLLSDIVDGTQPLNGRLLSRVAMYASAGRQTYQSVRQRQQKSRGAEEEKNNLTARENCPGCLSESGRGWVPIGTLIPPGGRNCRSNCRCFLTFRRKGAEQDVA